MEVGQPNNLAVDTTLRGIIKLTLPLSLARVVPELNYLFNSVFLGHLGTRELAYASTTGVYYLIFAVIGYGLSSAVLSIISKHAGENQREQIINVLRHAFLLGLGIVVVGLIITYFFLPHILYTFGLNPIDITPVSKFLYIRIWGLVFLIVYQLCVQYLICIGETKWIIVGSAIEAGANVLFDYLFIFGALGIAGIGFNGAAYASVVAECIGMLAMIAIITSNKFAIKYDIPNTWQYSKKMLFKILDQSYPLMAQYAISIITWWIFFLMVSKNYGYVEQAASQTMRNIFGLSGIFSWAFGSSTNAIVSNLIGQGKYDQIIPTIKRITSITFTGMCCFVVLINISPSYLFMAFDQSSPEFLNIGVTLLRIVSIALLILTIGVIWLHGAIASGESKRVFFIELASIIVYLIWVYITIEMMGSSVIVAWMSEWLYWTVGFVLSYIFVKKYVQKSVANIEKCN